MLHMRNDVTTYSKHTVYHVHTIHTYYIQYLGCIHLAEN